MTDPQIITKTIVVFTFPLATDFNLLRKTVKDDKFLNQELDKYINKIHEANKTLPKSKQIEIFYRENNILVTEKECILCIYADMI